MSEIYRKMDLNLAFTTYTAFDPINTMHTPYMEVGIFVEDTYKMCWKSICLREYVW